ncbi:putative baseplate assembly protein [Sulfitobacter sp. JB4-11]|uniref:putative baseplate assembly protein n=1 Tax=Sulfitobacter rhodophyticola TaxID=3238304 RepID=UPI003D817105
MIYHCCDPRRRERVLEAIDDGRAINGIDFLEVLDLEAPAPTPRQRTLLLRFLDDAPLLDPEQIAIEGGERVTGITVDWTTRADAPVVPPAESDLATLLQALPEPENVLVLRTSSAGDYSTYRLRLLGSELAPPDGIDRILSVVDFSFKVECPTDFDCAPVCHCDEDLPPPPPLSYLAKDYQSFRRMMLGRMRQLLPDWRESNPADLGITLVEMLAFTADRLSYAQDAAATESYLATARRRPSVRRHARLVDYMMHDGASARVFVHVAPMENGSANIARGTRFLTRVGEFDAAISDPGDQARALAFGPLVFEALEDRDIDDDQSEMDFYDWGNDACCLPKGSTRATLLGNIESLQPGHILIFEEVLGPLTGEAADADPSRRHAVMLTDVQADLTDDLTGDAITEIRWADEDALPFALCLSSRLDASAGGGLVRGVSHALGNIVLADHGASIDDEGLGAVPTPHLNYVPTPDASCDPCARPELDPVPPRFRPRLIERPVTQSAARPADATGTVDDPVFTSAYATLHAPDVVRLPWISLQSGDEAMPDWWRLRPDLISSAPEDRHAVLEVQSDGEATLRFGDDGNGRRPNPGTPFRASYRIGNGPVGNIGRDAIAHALTGAAVRRVRNPLPAVGGRAPESMEEVRQAAPYAYRRQERAVTTEDYAAIARRFPDVQRAAATFRWNGHGHTVFVTVDRFGGRPVTPEFEAALITFLDGYRMAGYDLQIDAPIPVSLEIALFICAAQDHFAAQVRRAVLDQLSAERLPDGRTGFFHPDNYTFADPVYLSALYARVMAVPGVASVKATRFRRRGQRSSAVALRDGVLTFGRLEIAQLENDRNFPERGALELVMGGGK